MSTQTLPTEERWLWIILCSISGEKTSIREGLSKKILTPRRFMQHDTMKIYHCAWFRRFLRGITIHIFRWYQTQELLEQDRYNVMIEYHQEMSQWYEIGIGLSISFPWHYRRHTWSFFLGKKSTHSYCRIWSKLDSNRETNPGNQSFRYLAR